MATEDERHRLEGELFERALDRPEHEREGFVREQAGDDEALAREVLSLLDAQGGAGNFLEPAPGAGNRIDPAAWLGHELGGFVVEELLGEGGMGMVFRARQRRPERTVALKLVGSRQPSEPTLRRFELEAELLARLEHPNIARVHAAGSSPPPGGEGPPIPWLAMEHVDGPPITTWAEREDLDREHRLALWRQACLAVHHAHQNAILHRDLKPANILVRPGGEPVVVDFGVARLLSEDDARTRLTQEGQLVGSVAYMAPEQLRGAQAAVDARADVYALGVIGHELLVGELPFGLGERSLGEAIHRVTDEDRPREPSARAQQLPADLRVLLESCLAARPDDRYSSAAALAADIGHVLADEPIDARPPSRAEQWHRFARRNRALVGAAGLAVVALVAGLAFSISGWQAASTAREQAESEAAHATALNHFLQEVLVSADPYADGREVRVVEVLDRAGEQLRSSLAGQPRVAVQAMGNLGTTYDSLGEYGRSEQLFRRALALADSTLPAGDPGRVGPLRNLGGHHIASRNLAAAGSLATRGRALLGQLDPSEHPKEVGDLQHFLGNYEVESGELEAGIRRLEAAVALSREALGPRHPETLASQVALGIALMQADRLGEAGPHLEAALAAREERFGPDHPATLVALNNLAFVYQRQDEHERAHEMFSRSLASRQRVHGVDNPSTAVGHHNMALQLGRMGRYGEALPHHERALEIFGAMGSAGEVRVSIAQAALGGSLRGLERNEDARRTLEESYRGLVAGLGAGHWRATKVATELAELLGTMGEDEEARRYRELAGDD